MNCSKYRHLLVVTTGVLFGTFAASAVARTLPNPNPSEYADGESSICVPIDPNYGPLLRLGLAADFALTNAVIVAFGTDADNDGNLSPEETEGRVGVDCGVVQVKVEDEQRGDCASNRRSPTDFLIASAEESTHHCSPSPLTFTLKQPKAVCWNLAKVTTHNLTSTNLVVKLSCIGTTIFVR